MATFTTDTGPPAGRRQFVITGVLLVLAVILASLPAAHQQLIASVIRGTVLKPFVLTQESVADVRVRTESGDELRARLDSMIAVLATHYTLSEENQRLRDLLTLGERTGPSYRPSSVVRSGTAGSESMFHLNLGYEDGVRENAPVLVRSGLLGVVQEIRPRSAIGMDWTHPEFRASAMTADGGIYGIVETRRGQFREQDRLLFDGTPFHTRLEEGTPVVTSGLGGIFPRGVPIGTVDALAEAEGGWRKAYWLRPVTRPGSATHVLVEVEGSGAGPSDLSSVWPADSILHERYVRPREREREVRAVGDSVPRADTAVAAAGLRARGAELFQGDSAGLHLVVRMDTTGAVATEGAGRTGSPDARTPTPAAGTPTQTPSPAQQPRPPAQEEGAAPPDTGAEEQEGAPVVRNLEAVIDSIRRARADTTAGRTPPDTTRPDTTRPDTNRVRPDTNRVDDRPERGEGSTLPSRLLPVRDGSRSEREAIRRGRGTVGLEVG